MEEPRTLFQDYSEIADVEYLGIDAIDLWKSWLYACPGMKPVDISERTPERRRQGICNENCSDDWLSYVTVLSDWVPKERLSVRARQQRQREIQQIRDSAKTCSGP